MKMPSVTHILSLCLAFSVLAVLSPRAHAADFAERHPRRAEIDRRERNQERRIQQGLKDGKLTKGQAKTLEGEEAGVKAQEKAEVKANGGYLTKSEQKQLNQELNQDSKQIYKEKHP